MAASIENAQMARLADSQWRARRPLEHHLFKLVCANVLTIAGDRRFIGLAIAEVDAVVAQIRLAEALRTGGVGAVACEWNVPAFEVGLESLVERAPESLRAAFEDHCVVFRNSQTRLGFSPQRIGAWQRGPQ
ncbi:MAG: hypothetical protein U9N84_12110 [Actinomycetota bacterium]|nr:hypothetical protein [Actinomycetota bacterium]